MSLTWPRKRREAPPVACGHGPQIAALEEENGRLRGQVARQQDEWQSLNLQYTGALRDRDDARRLLGEAIGREATALAALAEVAEGRDTALGLLETREDRPEWPDAGTVTGVPEVDDLRARCRALERRVADLQRANEDRDWAAGINNESTTGGER